jgi:hypothetical protein
MVEWKAKGISAMDPAAAAKLVESLDRELAKRRRKKYDGLIAQWRKDYADLVARGREEWGDDETIDDEAVDDAGDDAGRAAVYVFCRLIEHQKAYGPFPAEFFPPPGDIDERIRLEEFFAEHGGVEGVADAISELARRLRVRDRILEEQRNGAPRRRPVIITPKVRAPHLLDRETKPTGENGEGKSAKMSRSEKWKAEQAAQAEARQQLLPPRPEPIIETPLGFFRGVVAAFDQRLAIGVVKFSGAAGFSEAPLAPGAFRGSGLTVLIPNQTVDCQVVRRLDGSVYVHAIRLASGANPQDSAAQAAADAERFQMQLGMRKYH